MWHTRFSLVLRLINKKPTYIQVTLPVLSEPPGSHKTSQLRSSIPTYYELNPSSAFCGPCFSHRQFNTSKLPPAHLRKQAGRRSTRPPVVDDRGALGEKPVVGAIAHNIYRGGGGDALPKTPPALLDDPPHPRLAQRLENDGRHLLGVAHRLIKRR
jgi:hypothetical protein